MPQGAPSIAFLSFVVVVVLVVAGVGAALLYEHNHPNRPGSPQVVAVGDNVTVNYIGLFANGSQLGKVFDTSIKAIATNNGSWPKSLEYTPRNSSGYTPLPVHVGPNAPSGGYNISGTDYGSVVTGFWKGLLGLAVNQTAYVTFNDSEGYGALDPSCLKTGNLTQTLPVVVTVEKKSFATAYPGVTATAGTVFADPTYGWTDTILSANASTVVVGRSPSVGETVSPFGWSMVVTNITSATITLKSQLTPASVGSVLGSFPNVTVCSATKFLLSAVNLAGGSFTENYNKEVVGVSLTFRVTIVSIVTS